MKRLLFISVALFAVLFGLSFALLNAEPVTIHYYFGVAWRSPLVIVLFSVLTLGTVLGFTASLGLQLRLRRELNAARREVSSLEREVMNLRALPIRDML